MEEYKCPYDDFQIWARKHGWLNIRESITYAVWVTPSGLYREVYIEDGHVRKII